MATEIFLNFQNSRYLTHVIPRRSDPAYSLTELLVARLCRALLSRGKLRKIPIAHTIRTDSYCVIALIMFHALFIYSIDRRASSSRSAPVAVLPSMYSRYEVITQLAAGVVTRTEVA